MDYGVLFMVSSYGELGAIRTALRFVCLPRPSPFFSLSLANTNPSMHRYLHDWVEHIHGYVGDVERLVKVVICIVGGTRKWNV